MTLAAAQVVDAVAALLVPLAATGGRVYTSRTWPLEQGELPAWRVTAESESVESVEVGSDTNLHLLSIVCQATARATANLDDVLHGLAEGGMALLFAGTPPNHLQLTGIDRTVDGTGEAALGTIDLAMQASFYVRQSVPGTIIS